jgi:uroporphyrinogen decarboxylase
MPIIESEFVELTAGLDLDAFWSENAVCQDFTPHKPRCALSLSPDDHWLFEFMDVPSTRRYYHEKAYRDELHREVNEIMRQYVGKTFFDEDTWEHSPKRIENLFGCEFTYTEGATPWLTAATSDPEEFARILDQAERTDVAKWALPEEFLREWEARRAAGKELTPLGTGSRGPATIMTSVLHPETAIYWFHDHAALMRRFRDTLARQMVAFNRVLRAFSGASAAGWWITDDNSALFSPKLYREYCVPVLQQILSAMAPGAARRYQHSDSAMGHLLDDQLALGVNSVNYGPAVDAALIRAKMPAAVINGHTPPLLLRNGAPDEIVERVRSDFAKAGATGGLVVTTAGSLAAGTGMGRVRWFMQAVQQHCRYDERHAGAFVA